MSYYKTSADSMTEIQILYKTLIVGSLATNCYIVVDQKNAVCAIIDPGDDTDYITQALAELQVKPVSIIATHGHFDHILAAGELQVLYKIPFYIHHKDIFLVERMQESGQFFLKRK